MKALKTIGLGLIVLVVVVVVVGLFLSAEFSTERSTSVAAPVAVVFDQVVDLEKNEAWMPWRSADPTMKLSYGDKTVGAGASYSWTSENSGKGTLTIREVEQNKRIVNDLDFQEQGTATGFWNFEEIPEGTKVTWGMKGDAGGNIIARYMGLMVESMAGPQFEKGLAELKKVSESAPATESTAEATEE